MDEKTDSERLLSELGLTSDDMTEAAINKLMEMASDNAKLRARIVDLQERLEQAKALADMDPLCPLFNRRAFLRELNREIAIAERHGTDLSVLYIDLDQFKRINDEHGHEIGDQVLFSFAELLSANVRKTDIVGRIGGDEFAVILIRANAWQTSTRIHALHEAVDRQSRHLRDLKASIGAVAWHPGASATATLREADRAMFANKTGIKGT